jgi:hypothetical protein
MATGKKINDDIPCISKQKQKQTTGVYTICITFTDTKKK